MLMDRPIPDISVPALPQAHLSFDKDGRARASPSEATLLAKKSVKAKGKEKAIAPELDNRPYEKEVSKRQKAKVGVTSIFSGSIDLIFSNRRRLPSLNYGLPFLLLDEMLCRK
jgi:hypothetical protein